MNYIDEKKEFSEGLNIPLIIWSLIAKRKKLIICMILIGIISAIFMNMTMDKVYQGEAAIRILDKQELNVRELIDMIGKINEDKIAMLFPKAPEKIKSAKIKQISGSADKFILAVEMTQPELLPLFVDEFIRYLRNLPYIKATIDQQKEKLAKRIEEIDSLIKRTEEECIIYKKRVLEGKLNPIRFNPVELNKPIMDLKNERIDLQKTLDRLNGFELIALPGISSHPIRPKPFVNILAAGSMGLILAMILATFLNYLGKNKKEPFKNKDV